MLLGLPATVLAYECAVEIVKKAGSDYRVYSDESEIAIGSHATEHKAKQTAVNAALAGAVNVRINSAERIEVTADCEEETVKPSSVTFEWEPPYRREPILREDGTEYDQGDELYPAGYTWTNDAGMSYTLEDAIMIDYTLAPEDIASYNVYYNCGDGDLLENTIDTSYATGKEACSATVTAIDTNGLESAHSNRVDKP